MLTVERRPMTEQERKTIRKLSKGGGDLFDRFFETFINLFLPVVGGVLLAALIGRTLEWLFSLHAGRILLTIGTAAGAVVGIRLELASRKVRGLSSSSYRQDLDQGEMEVLRCQVRDAVAVEEAEDEGLGFFFDIGDSQILFLQGQYLYEPVEEKKFPCRTFELVRTPVTKLVFDIVCTGEPLAASRTLKPLSTSAYEWLEDQKVFPESLESLEDKLQSTVKRRTARKR